MTVVDSFKGGEAEWVDWKFKFLNAVGTGSKAMRRVLTWVEENTTKGETLTAEKAVEEIQNVNHGDSIAGAFHRIAGMSGEIVLVLGGGDDGRVDGGGENGGKWRWDRVVGNRIKDTIK